MTSVTEFEIQTEWVGQVGHRLKTDQQYFTGRKFFLKKLDENIIARRFYIVTCAIKGNFTHYLRTPCVLMMRYIRVLSLQRYSRNILRFVDVYSIISDSNNIIRLMYCTIITTCRYTSCGCRCLQCFRNFLIYESYFVFFPLPVTRRFNMEECSVTRLKLRTHRNPLLHPPF